MKIKETDIRDFKIFIPEPIGDERGWFAETFKASLLGESIVQSNHSYTKLKYTFRGLHFQWEPSMGKYMRVIKGDAILIAVDIRIGSPTFGKNVHILSSANNKKILWAPAGAARGFLTLTDDVEIEYFTTGEYNKECEAAISYKSCGLFEDIKEDIHLSERDTNAMTLDEWVADTRSKHFQYVK